MSAIGLLILGIIVLIVDYFLPLGPPILHAVLRILGWCCVAVSIVLIFALIFSHVAGMSMF